jgi:thiol:disulfide interchange protein DsbC
MKKLQKFSLTALTLLASIAFAGTELSKKEIEQLKTDYPQLIGKQGIVVKKGIDQGKFKQLELEIQTRRGPQQFEVFVVKGVDDVVFAGSAFNKVGDKYSLPVNEKAIKDAVAFEMGNGSETLYLVTDPECPYCQRLEKAIKPEALKKYTIKVIPMPLSFHKKAKPMYTYILAGKDNKEKSERMHKTMTGDTSYQNYKPTEKETKTAEEIFKKGYVGAKELKAGGTPSLYNSKFQKVTQDLLTK